MPRELWIHGSTLILKDCLTDFKLSPAACFFCLGVPQTVPDRGNLDVYMEHSGAVISKSPALCTLVGQSQDRTASFPVKRAEGAL